MSPEIVEGDCAVDALRTHSGAMPIQPLNNMSDGNQPEVVSTIAENEQLKFETRRLLDELRVLTAELLRLKGGQEGAMPGYKASGKKPQDMNMSAGKQAASAAMKK